MPIYTNKIHQWINSSGLCSVPEAFLCRDATCLHLFAAAIQMAHPNRPLVFVLADGNQADLMFRASKNWGALLHESRSFLRVPEVRGLRQEWVTENEASFCTALDSALSGQPAIYCAEAAALLPANAPPEQFQRLTFSLKTGQIIPPKAIVDRLIQLDYDNEIEVSIPGEFSRRGGILDIFSPLSQRPVRLEFFGDEIESIRLFNPETQRSVKSIDHIRIIPRGQVVLQADGVTSFSFLDYFPSPPLVILCSPLQIIEHLETFGTEELHGVWQQLVDSFRETCIHLYVETHAANRLPETYLSPPGFSLPEALLPSLPELGAEALSLHWQLLRDNLIQWHQGGFSLVACCGSKGETQRFRDMLSEDDLTRKLDIDLIPLPLETGISLPEQKLMMLSEKELFGKHSPPPRRSVKNYRSEIPADATELEDGCYAVHAIQGICIFHGITTIEAGGTVQEVMELEFAEEARLFVPLDQSYLVSRYIGGTRKLPRISRIGSAVWKNNKLAAQASAEDLAAELLRLEAMRKHARGVAFKKQAEWEEDFAAAFPYAETEDQQRAIEETLQDMERTQPMDRLLCGDVGYGKTEVAMRAAFRAVMNGRQVAILVPTTILAQQHFITFRNRMAEYPVIIDMLSRFKTHGEQSHILERLALGSIDIIIGTHRLVQKDVAFADLGLVIIDEEQRFGVKHKEKLKQLRASVDILTMTATPIPRTLYFSLSGLKNLSTIMTAPSERLPVKTMVAQYDEALLRSAILRELEREGQVFVLHNRVRTIEAFCRQLSRLVPEARFAVAHGQMSAHDLEAVMLDYVHAHIDVLVCTTIIESGVDIPNANTIIIDHAERFGLAELYQLRGRVGRYHNQAYAYLLLPPMGILPKNARERISAVRQYTHLGAGFKLALRDLEIRGAGNILGQEQSGQIAAVGFELYCELLRDAVNRLENQPTQAEKKARVFLDTVAFGTNTGPGREPAAFPADFIEAEQVRVHCYRRLQKLKTIKELTSFKQELHDRFGLLPKAAEMLLGIHRIRILAETRGIREVLVNDRRILLRSSGKPIPSQLGKLPKLTARDGDRQLQELAEVLKSLPAAE